MADNAGEAIRTRVYAVKFGLTVSDLADTGPPYRTMTKGRRLAAQAFTTNVEMLSCCAA